MYMDIPAGLTYVDGTGSIASGAKSAMGFDILDWTENTLMINGSASAANYQSDSDTVIAVFDCIVDDDASGTLSVSLKDLEIGNCLTFEIFTDLFDVIPADVTIIDEPTAAPEPETEPATEPEIHVHHLTFVEEIPATYESDGVKAHYICDGDDGCGKIFEDAFGTIELTEADLIIPRLVRPTEAPVTEPVVAPTSAPVTEPVVAPTSAPITEPATEAEPIIGPTMPPTPAQHMQIKVVADKSEASPDDTVNFSIVLGPVSDIGSVQMFLLLQSGLTYVDGSGKIADGARAAMGFDILEWTESSLMVNGSASAANYQSDTDTTIATFACTVDSDASGTLTVGLDDLEIGDCETFVVFTELFNVITADVAIVSAPTQRPTTSPTEKPTGSSTRHRHRLTRVREVPATEDSEGIKAHYICSGEDGCGKIYQDFFGTIELTMEDLIIPRLVPATETPATEPIVNPTTAPVTQPVVVPTIATEPATEAVPIIGPTMPPTPAQHMQIKVVADKSEASPDDTVNFSVVLGPVSDIGSVQMFLLLQSGLTYVDGSGKIADGARAAMGFDILEWTESSLMVNGSASNGDYASTGDLTIATFSCIVDDDASGTLTVGLNGVEMGSCVTFEILTELFDVIPADVTVIDVPTPRPTQAPTQRPTLAPPTQRPTSPPTQAATIRPTVPPTERPVTHRHRLTYVREVPATYESDGVKAHYICSGNNGCGKIFEDAFGTIELTEADLIIPRLVRPTEAPVTEPVVEPTTAPVTEPATEAEPIIGPTMPPATEPVVAPTTAPVTEPVVAPTSAPVTEPATEAEPIIGPTMPPATEPVVEPTTAPVTEPVVVPTSAPVTEPATEAEPIIGPTMPPATEPVVVPTSAPVTEPATEAEPIIGPTMPPATEPVVEPTAAPVTEPAPSKPMQIKVVADKNTAMPGDTVNFSVVLGPVSDIGSIQMSVVIPSGLTYVDGTGSIASGAKSAMGFDILDWTENTLMITGSASAGDYASTGDLTIATFSCTVDDNASGTLTVGLSDLEMGSCVTFEIITELFEVIPADVTITDQPVTEPATEAEPIIGPTMPPATEPVVETTDSTEPVVEPTIKPTTEPATEAEPIIGPTMPPATEPVVAPTTAPVTEPVVAPTSAPVTEPATEAEPIIGPTMPPATEPVVEPTAAPVTEPTTEPATEPTVAPTEPDHPHCTDKFFIRFDAASAGWYCSRSVWCCIYEIGSGKQINACYYGMLPGFACGSIWTFNASCMGVKEGRQYAVIFKNGWSETYPLVMDSSCSGCTARCTGKWIENPYSFCKYSPEARWDNSSLGPLLQITSYGKVIGETCPCNTTKYDMFVRFLTTVRRSGCVYGKKLNDVINSTARDLGLSDDDVKRAKIEAGFYSIFCKPYGFGNPYYWFYSSFNNKGCR